MGSDVAFDLDEIYKMWLMLKNSSIDITAGPRFKD